MSVFRTLPAIGCNHNESANIRATRGKEGKQEVVLAQYQADTDLMAPKAIPCFANMGS